MMTRKTKMIGKIVAKFIVNMLPKIKGEPNYGSIKKIMQLLYANIETLLIPQGVGHHGHIRIFMNPTLYNTLSTTVCTNPSNPGIYPTVPTSIYGNYPLSVTTESG